MRPHGRFRANRSAPRAQAVCDRCGFRYALSDLQFQFDWRGTRMQNLRILVCEECLDVPQEQLRTFVLPQDPVPVNNPRPEQFTLDDNPISALGWPAAALFPSGSPGNIGNMGGGGGVDAAFFGGQSKLSMQSATLAPSIAGLNNFVGKNWSLSRGAPTVPSSLAPPVQSYFINTVTVTAPSDLAFLGSNLTTTIELDGSNDGVGWTSLASKVTFGNKGESVTFTSSMMSSVTNWAYHRVVVSGDGANQVSIARVHMSAAGPSFALTGSELGA